MIKFCGTENFEFAFVKCDKVGESVLSNDNETEWVLGVRVGN